MNYKSILSAAFMSLCFFCESPARAWNITARCDEEKHDGDNALGRIKWAQRCGYIRSQEFFIAERLFPVFRAVSAPVNEWDDCGNFGEALGTCKWGCYVPSQTVMFSEREVPFIEALQKEVKTVTSLSDLRMFEGHEPYLMEQAVAEVTEGETTEDVYYITSTAGNKLAVSAKHPVIEASGRVITADQVVAGETVLLGRSGALQIESVEVKSFSGKLYNISPVSEKVAHNILIADDFLTGSLRYQNEWSKDQSRLFLRSQIDID